MAVSDHDLGGSLRSRVDRQPGATRIALSGNLSEAANLTPLIQLPGPLVIDLGDIGRINSLGVRTWIDFVKKCEARTELTFERVSPAMVSQMSMISNFMGTRARVTSVLVPYLCPACNTEATQLLAIAPGAQLQLTMTCPKCKAQMELEDLVETYGTLLQRA